MLTSAVLYIVKWCIYVNCILVKRNLVIGWYRSAVVSAVISVSSSADLERPLYSQVQLLR